MTTAMKMSEALKVIQAAPKDANPFRVAIICGYTPLHLVTFLAAHLQLALPERRVVVTTGLYGNLALSLETLAYESMDAVALSIEWEDIDSRLGFRSAGRWDVESVDDILANVGPTLERFTEAISCIPPGPRVAIAPPSILLPPLFHTPGFQASTAELVLMKEITDFQLHVAAEGRCKVVSPQQLAEMSPHSSRYDLKSDLATGLPYSLQHASFLAALLARNLAPPPPKKGIITDLDDTLWSGIVGEVGPEAVRWDLASHAHLHALYQKLLASLSTEGVLVAIASKNDAAIVDQALQRKDLLLSSDLAFPIEVHWGVKSGSIDRILKTWNIAADSVVFVDDSPMELAEVAAAHPGIETVLFPKNDVSQGLGTLRRLRDLCGKERLAPDDKIRVDSIRRGATFREQVASGSVPESFLRELNSILTFDFQCADSARVFELVNKTNQFNLNGIRYTESEWRKLVSVPDSILVSTAYEDKFGPLGVIAVLQGQMNGSRIAVNTLVLSCRAFARRIEHAMLQSLFGCSEVQEVELSFVATAKNGPLQNFLTAITGERPASRLSLTREQFNKNCPQLYHEIREIRGAEANA